MRPTLLLCACTLLSAPAAAPAATVNITRAGAGSVKVGMTYRALRAKGLVGRIGPGCEAAGVNARSALLRPPLRGSVDFTLTVPRRVRSISVTGGGAARNVHVGTRKSAIRRSFPTAVFRHEELFGGTFATVGPRGGGPLDFFVADATGRVRVIGVPFVPVCE